MAKAHKRYSASKAQVWLNCPAAVRLSDAVEKLSSAYAEEGTLAHLVADTALRRPRLKTGAFDVVGAAREIEAYYRDKGDEETADLIGDEMLDAVETYTDYVLGLLKRFPAAEWSAEMQIEMDAVHPLTGGTTDFVLYDPPSKTLVVADFKYGKGKIVSPEENPQAMIYALGAILRHHNRGVREVVVTIVQPRTDPEPKTWETDSTEVFGWIDRIQAAIVAAERADSQPVAGPWCRDGFCDYRGQCAAFRRLALETAKIEFAEDPEEGLSVQPPQVQHMSPVERAAVLAAADQLSDWIKKVQQTEHARAEAGDIAPGYKLVAKRGTRKWIKPEAEVVAVYTTKFGLSEDDVRPRKLLTVAQLEKVVGKKNFEEGVKPFIGYPFWEKVSSGTNLVPEDDPRPAYTRASAADEFAE